MKPSALPLLILAFASSAGHAADNCEPLRLQIAANIASKGLSDFSVTTVDAAATLPGQVVGSCDNGAKKIVYARGSAQAVRPVAPAALAPPQAAATKPKATTKSPRDEPILTECKDGSVSMGGRCR